MVGSNSRGWMEDRLSGPLGRVDGLLKTLKWDVTAPAHANSQTRHAALAWSNCCGERSALPMSPLSFLHRDLSPPSRHFHKIEVDWWPWQKAQFHWLKKKTSKKTMSQVQKTRDHFYKLRIIRNKMVQPEEHKGRSWSETLGGVFAFKTSTSFQQQHRQRGNQH